MDTERLGIGLSLPTWPRRDGTYASWPELRMLALEVEAAGVDTLWVPDHLLRMLPDRPPVGFWECWTILTATAEATSRIEVGPFIACTGFRNPALLAKMAATLDEVSGGRLVLGLGSGVPATDASWRMFGYDADRHVSGHAEAAEIIARMLREPPVTFHGDHHRTEAADIRPRGPRPAGPPIWLAAKGDRTLAIAARWGDAVNMNVMLTGADDVPPLASRLAAACEAAGRDVASVALTGVARLALRADGTAELRPGWIGGTPDEAGRTLRAIHAAGMRHLTLYVGEADDPSPLPALTSPVLDRLLPILEVARAS